MATTVEDVLLELVGLCDSLDFKYVVMGGLAVRVHGIPRPTYDVDFELGVSSQQLNAFFDGAEKLGYEISDVYRKGWRDSVGGMPLVKLKTWVSSSHSIDVDIFINDTPFQAAIMDRRLSIPFEDRDLWFVTPEDLILLKLLAYRPRDQGDIADILFVQGQLDEAYLRQWAQSLDITDRLEKALTDARS